LAGSLTVFLAVSVSTDETACRFGGSLDRWIDVSMLDSLSAVHDEKPFTRGPTAGNRNEGRQALHQHHRRTHQCLQLLFTHRSSGEKEQQPRATNLSTDPREVTARRFTGGQRLLAFSILANVNFPRRGRSRERRRHLWGSTFTEVPLR
jgi:hypothetical protein